MIWLYQYFLSKITSDNVILTLYDVMVTAFRHNFPYKCPRKKSDPSIFVLAQARFRKYIFRRSPASTIWLYQYFLSRITSDDVIFISYDVIMTAFVILLSPESTEMYFFGTGVERTWVLSGLTFFLDISMVEYDEIRSPWRHIMSIWRHRRLS